MFNEKSQDNLAEQLGIDFLARGRERSEKMESALARSGFRASACSLPSFPESRALIDCVKGAYIALILSPFELNNAYPYPLAFYRYGPADSRCK
jgi:hypothetical protein